MKSGRLILQSGVARQGRQVRWHTVCKFSDRTAPQVQRAAQMLAGADHGTLWRVVSGDSPLVEVARWTGADWV